MALMIELPSDIEDRLNAVAERAGLNPSEYAEILLRRYLPSLESTEERTEGKTLAEALKGKIGVVSFEPTDLSQNTGQRFTDLLMEKWAKDSMRTPEQHLAGSESKDE